MTQMYTLQPTLLSFSDAVFQLNPLQIDLKCSVAVSRGVKNYYPPIFKTHLILNSIYSLHQLICDK